MAAAKTAAKTTAKTVAKGAARKPRRKEKKNVAYSQIKIGQDLITYDLQNDKCLLLL